MICAGCKDVLDENNSLKCNACVSYYCLECLNLGKVSKASDIGPDQLSSIRCPSCTNVSRRRGNESPAVLSPAVVKRSTIAQRELTIENISELLDQKLAPTSSIMINSRNILIKEVQGLLVKEMNKIAKDLRDEFIKTTDFIMEEVKDLKSAVAEKNTIIKTLQHDNTQLKDELKLLRNRFGVIEKLSRERNIEIQAVPEKRGENIVSIVKALCETVQLPISDSDIHACRRVAKMDAASKRPRNIVVTLKSPRLRDSVISAVHRYNKEHKDRKLNSKQLGITDINNQIYVSEHLSPECKQLYAAARRSAKDKNYTYCWVKYGQIYLRKSDNTDAIRVNSVDFLKSLK